MKEHHTIVALEASDSLCGWIDSVAYRMIHRAASRAPGTLSERLEEEWLADLSEQREGIARLRFALGCYWAAAVISCGDGIVTNAPTSPVAVANTVAYTYHRPSLRKRRMTASANGNAICDINTTPLIDVMLVLLVTLIVSLPLMTHAVKLDLPHAPPLSDTIRPEVINLEIDSDGTVVWNGTALASWEQLEGYFRTEAQRSPQPEIHLRPDRRVNYDSVVKVLAAAQRNRMQKIGFVDTAQFKD